MAELNYPGQDGDDERDGFGRRDDSRDYRDWRDRDRGRSDDDRQINVNQAAGLAEVATTAIKVGGKNVNSFWQLLIIVLLVGMMIIGGITIVVTVKYLVPEFSRAQRDLATRFSDTLKESVEEIGNTHKEIGKENRETFERTLHEKDEQHIRQMQLLLDRDRDERKDFERRVGIKAP